MTIHLIWSHSTQHQRIATYSTVRILESNHLGTATVSSFFYLDTVPNDDNLGKVAKGKLLAKDYNLHCYTLVFQLAVKEGTNYLVSNIQCETNLVNESEFT